MKIKNFITASAVAALAMFSVSAQANTITADAARMAAKNFINQHVGAKGRFSAPASVADIKLMHAEASAVEGNAYYVFNITGGGWVIVAGDDHARQVLAYGDKGYIDMNEMPANMKGQLDIYKKQIEVMQNYKGDLVPRKAPKRVNIVEPLTVATWGQQEPMNRLCPKNSSGKLTSVGCGPLAMAQIVYYWKYPQSCPALAGYYVNGLGSIPSLDATTFDYSKMLDTYTIYNPSTGGVALGTYTDEQANEVAKLCRYAGQACKARYGNSGSTSTGSYTYDQLAAFKTFGYNENAQLIGFDPSYYCDNSNKYSEEEWIDRIVTELQANRPIPYHNVDFEDGHAWILDGIDADNKLHMNWGFYERFNGWFEFGAFGFYPYGDSEYWDFSSSGSTSNEMIINLMPYEGYVIPIPSTRGDVNNNGRINITDVTILVNYLLSKDATGVDLDAADCNLDNIITISDVTALINYLLAKHW